MLAVGAYDFVLYLAGGSFLYAKLNHTFAGKELLAVSVVLLCAGLICLVTSLWVSYKALTGDLPPSSPKGAPS
jgi:hypothetical protein